MFKKLILIVFGISPLLLAAQVDVDPQIPPAGMVQKDQLWNLILTGKSEGILDVDIKFNLQNRTTGQTVLSGTSGHVMLGREAKAISSNVVQPITYTSGSQDFSGTYLPVGSYTICYQLSINGSEYQSLTDGCIQINVDPLSPALLNAPFDQEEIQTGSPAFAWMSPTGSDPASNLNYDLTVTEILSNQSPIESMQNNVPVYNKKNMVHLSENDSTSNGVFLPDKIYAWQIIVKNAQGFMAKSNIWTFKMKGQN